MRQEPGCDDLLASPHQRTKRAGRTLLPGDSSMSTTADGDMQRLLVFQSIDEVHHTLHHPSPHAEVHHTLLVCASATATCFSSHPPLA